MSILLSCDKSDDINQKKLIGIEGTWKVSDYTKSDDNPNGDGRIFGVYCNKVIANSDRTITFYLNDLEVYRGSWEIINENQLNITLDNNTIIKWDIRSLNMSTIILEERFKDSFIKYTLVKLEDN